MERDQFNAQLCEFLSRATSPFHAVGEMARQLTSAGFQPLAEDSRWQLSAGGRYFLVRNHSSIVAFVVGSDSAPGEGMRMVGAHTDSPCLMVKPVPEVSRNGYLQLGVQVYGGALLNPWFDRDLSIAGKVSYRSEGGELRSALLDLRDPVAFIPSLAIHLDREANKNRTVNAQKHLAPILCHLPAGEQADFRGLLCEHLRNRDAGLSVDSVLDYELCLYDTQPPAVVGLRGEFIASARLDNLLSCFTALQAMLHSDGKVSSLMVCNDHEEVGSVSAVGAQGPLLQSTLRRLAGDETDYVTLVQRSMMISADNAHGVHPNYADRHDDNHGPLLNEGPVIKINASQRYATNSETSGLFRMLCEAAGVPVQSFVVRSDMACGSTIGPITAGVTGIRTLDVGVPTFGMHSVRELAGASDGWYLGQVLRDFFDYRGPLAAG